MRLVLDASAAVHLVMRTKVAPLLVDHMQDASLVLAPALFHAEVANALWKYARAGQLTRDQALERAAEAGELIDRTIPDTELLTEALSAAVQHNHPVYDLLYAVTARRHGCNVLARDQRLPRLLERMAIPYVRV